jgi:hypothetical protein
LSLELGTQSNSTTRDCTSIVKMPYGAVASQSSEHGSERSFRTVREAHPSMAVEALPKLRYISLSPLFLVRLCFLEALSRLFSVWCWHESALARLCADVSHPCRFYTRQPVQYLVYIVGVADCYWDTPHHPSSSSMVRPLSQNALAEHAEDC